MTQSIEVHRRLNLSIEALGRTEMAERFPQVNWDGIEIGLYEPQLGALMARRAVQSLVAEFVSSGGEYRTASVTVQEPPLSASLEGVQTRDGEWFRAERYVFACGAWLPKMFPALLGARIFPTRQEVFYFAPAVGDSRFQAGCLPTWADFNNGDIYYGMPDLEGRIQDSA